MQQRWTTYASSRRDLRASRRRFAPHTCNDCGAEATGSLPSRERSRGVFHLSSSGPLVDSEKTANRGTAPSIDLAGIFLPRHTVNYGESYCVHQRPVPNHSATPILVQPRHALAEKSGRQRGPGRGQRGARRRAAPKRPAASGARPPPAPPQARHRKKPSQSHRSSSTCPSAASRRGASR